MTEIRKQGKRKKGRKKERKKCRTGTLQQVLL